jgi:MFS family permease
MAQPSIRLWRQRNFLLLWCGQSISQVGSQVTIWALPLTAVLVLHASPLQTGLLTAASIAPYVLAGLLAGAWVDRVQRRPLMIAADVGRALLLPFWGQKAPALRHGGNGPLALPVSLAGVRRVARTHFAPCQLNRISAFQAKPFAWVKV